MLRVESSSSFSKNVARHFSHCSIHERKIAHLSVQDAELQRALTSQAAQALKQSLALQLIFFVLFFLNTQLVADFYCTLPYNVSQHTHLLLYDILYFLWTTTASRSILSSVLLPPASAVTPEVDCLRRWRVGTPSLLCRSAFSETGHQWVPCWSWSLWLCGTGMQSSRG